MGYLERLTGRLADGLTLSPSTLVERHRSYLIASQRPDGGWSGREGDSDLYYTAFALRGLAVTAGITESCASRTAQFLRDQLNRPVNVVDFMSLLYAARLIHAPSGYDIFSQSGEWQARVASTLESFRKADGGYAKSVDAASGSTYHTFLVAVCFELIGIPIPGPDRVVDFVRSRSRDDGGYVEVSAARRGGTNPTAAAVAVLIMLGALDSNTRTSVTNFLASMQPAGGGGLRANDRAPFTDLLSTFTGLLSLVDLAATDRVDLHAARQFVDSIESSHGGFRGGVWDQATDAEYTFYGLGCIGLLNGLHHTQQ